MRMRGIPHKDRIGPMRLRILTLILQGAQRGVLPTITDLQEATGIRHPNGIVSHLNPLQKQGWITWEPFKCRTIRPLCRLAVFTQP